MIFRLVRIQVLVLSITTVMTIVALGFGMMRPLGIVLGGGAAWLDFVVIRKLGAAALSRRLAATQIVPMALLKSCVLIAVPALAVLLPAHLVDGMSFALGVTALPAAIVIDALVPLRWLQSR